MTVTSPLLRGLVGDPRVDELLRGLVGDPCVAELLRRLVGDPRVDELLRGLVDDPCVAEYLRGLVYDPHVAGGLVDDPRKHILATNYQEFPQDQPLSLKKLFVVLFSSLSLKSFRRGIG
jgi:hypothetical protein